VGLEGARDPRHRDDVRVERVAENDHDAARAALREALDLPLECGHISLQRSTVHRPESGDDFSTLPIIDFIARFIAEVSSAK